MNNNKKKQNSMRRPSDSNKPPMPMGQRTGPLGWLLLGLAFITIITMFDRYSVRDEISNDEFEKYLLEWAANENIKTNGKFDIKTFAVKIRKESATKATVIFNTKETSNEITRKFTNINGKWAQVK